jgi:hypothetical protein
MKRLLLAICSVLLLSTPAEAVYSCSIAATEKGTVGTALSVTTDAIDTTGADVIFVALSWYSGGGADITAAFTFSDNKSNTWDHKTATASGGATGIKTALFYTTSATPTVGGSHTVTAAWDSVSAFSSIYVLACSGAKAASPYDTESAGGGTSGATTVQPGSLTPAEDNEILITGVAHLAAGSSTIDAPFTLSNELPYSAGNYIGGGLAYSIQTTATARNPTWTQSSSVEAAAVMFAWKAQSGPGGSGGSCGDLGMIGIGC